jgi:general secretion pathway protein J
MMKMATRSRILPRTARGFTLLELLLAMAITGLVSVMAYAGLSMATQAAERHGEAVRRLGELQTGVGWLVRDLRQLVARPIKDGSDELRPAILGTELQDELLELTHTGWDNPRDQRRAAVQRVRYRLDPDGNLWRDHWLVLDRLDDEEQLQEVKLLTGVVRFELQFLQSKKSTGTTSPLGGDWVDTWPVEEDSTELPLAVQFDLEMEGIGIVHRVIGLAVPAPQAAGSPGGQP